MLNSSVRIAADAVAAEALDSGDESGGSPERKSMEGLLKAKKKKGTKKKVKKTVFRNNFIKESDSNQ